MMARIRRASMACLLVALAPMTAAAQLLTGNLLPNASVNDSLTGATPSYWHHGPLRAHGGAAGWLADAGPDGSHALHVDIADPTSVLRTHWRAHGLPAPASGTRLRFQWRWRHADVSDEGIQEGIQVAVRFFSGPVDDATNATGDIVTHAGLVARGTQDEWQRPWVDLTVPEGARSLDVVIQDNAPGVTGAVWCDDLSLAIVPKVTLHETFAPSALHDVSQGPLSIAGRVHAEDILDVRLRVTNGRGVSHVTQVASAAGVFRAVYPDDFPHAPALEVGMLFIDATIDEDFRAANQAEATIIAYDGVRGLRPDLPTVYTNDLIDAQENKDQLSREWPTVRALANLYMRSRGARIVDMGQADFDLANPDDLTFFRDTISLYDFDHRDRDWSSPLNNRPRRNFWKAVYSTWYNATNNNPLDGDPNNNHWRNFQPYNFSIDYADILIMNWLRLGAVDIMDDNLLTMCREGTETLLAMQHTTPDNFSLENAHGVQHVYTAGAFRYGMFINGTYMTEGTGWFHNPDHMDYYFGGVFNGRSVWGLGIALEQDPDGPLTERIKQAVQLALRFCLRDALAHGYAHTTPGGHTYWKDAGEHPYLLMGMLKVCAQYPDLPVAYGEGEGTISLREACIRSMEAQVELINEHNYWSPFNNFDSVALIALADGVALLRDHPRADVWLARARDVADSWLDTRVDPGRYPAEVIHFARRIGANEMCFHFWEDRTVVYHYQTGHWIHAYARLYALTGSPAYRERVEAMIAYLCGKNPWAIRHLSEIGAVHNWTDDTTGDGVEDRVKFDFYPESTCFSQIGIIYFMQALLTDAQATP